jgi:hypothetical protein
MPGQLARNDFIPPMARADSLPNSLSKLRNPTWDVEKSETYTVQHFKILGMVVCGEHVCKSNTEVLYWAERTDLGQTNKTPLVLSFRGTWLDCPISIGDSVNIIGNVSNQVSQTQPQFVPPLSAAPITSNNKNILTSSEPQLALVLIVDNRCMVVLLPDLMFPPTRLSTNTGCTRRFVLQHIGATGLSLPSEAMVSGNLIHALFEGLLKAPSRNMGVALELINLM